MVEATRSKKESCFRPVVAPLNVDFPSIFAKSIFAPITKKAHFISDSRWNVELRGCQISFNHIIGNVFFFTLFPSFDKGMFVTMDAMTIFIPCFVRKPLLTESMFQLLDLSTFDRSRRVPGVT